MKEKEIPKNEAGRLINGVKDGHWIVYHDALQKKEEGIYKHGKKDGFWTRWYENGQKTKKEFTITI